MKENKKQKQITKTTTNQKRTVGAGLASAQRISTQGITLIALVITIIVLLILASVAINLTLGDNGIFTKAKEARDNMERATLIERIQTEILEKQLANEETNINKGDLETILGKYGEPQKDAQGNITGLKPEGKEEIIPIEEIIENNKITEGSTAKPGESGYEGGAYNDPYIPKGFKHIGTEEWNQGYTIIGETSSKDNEFVWVPCVLTAEEQQAASAKNHEVQIFQKTTATTGKYNEFNLGLLPTDTTVEEEDTSVQAIEESVGKYGGFYIAKYEAGIEGQKDNYTIYEESSEIEEEKYATPTNGSYKPLSQADKGVWNYITRENAITVSKAMIDHNQTGVYSTLISGAAWDTTLQWITHTVDATYAENSDQKGHYDADNVALTGSSTAYSKNNIYDMAGNVWKWTTENCTLDGNSSLVIRGR